METFRHAFLGVYLDGVDAESVEHPSKVFSYCVFLDHTAITNATKSYPDGTRSDIKVSKNFRRWRI